MNPIKSAFVRLGVILALMVQPLGAGLVHAAKAVSTVEGLVAALKTAQNNGGNTYIPVEAGVFEMDASLAFGSPHGPSALPVIRTSVALVGSGESVTILDAKNFGRRLFTVLPGVTLTVRNMTLTGGEAISLDSEETVGGGAIGNFGGLVRLLNVSVAGNAALGYGGALLSTAGSMTLIRSEVSENYAVGEGVGGGGGIAVLGGRLRVVDSVIAQNRTEAMNLHAPPGGGLYASDADVVIRHSRLQGNRAGEPLGNLTSSSTSQGGGIFKTGDGLLLIEHSAIVKNEASGGRYGYAGGLYVRGGFKNRLRNVSILENTATYRGGGLVTSDSKVYLYGVTVSRNNVVGGNLQYCFEQTGEPPLACSSGAGIWSMESAMVAMSHTLVAENTLDASEQQLGFAAGADCRGAVDSLGHNAIGDGELCSVSVKRSDTDLLDVDVALSEVEFGAEPGSVFIQPYSSSPVIDGGEVAVDGSVFCSPRDQVGRVRNDGDRDGVIRCDIGAVEYR